MKRSKLLSLLSLSMTLLATGTAHAYTTYFGQDRNNSSTVPVASLANSNAARTSFLSTMSGAGTENFESIAAGTEALPGLNVSFTGYSGGTLNATLTGTGMVMSTSGGSTDLGRYSVPTGTNYWSADLTSSSSFAVNFGTAIAAFGFYGTDISDFASQAWVDVWNGGTLLKSIKVDATIATSSLGTDGSALYLGFVAQNTGELFTSVSFRSTGATATDVFGFDSFTIAEARQLNTALPSSQTPEPATMTLVGALLLGLGISRRRA